MHRFAAMLMLMSVLIVAGCDETAPRYQQLTLAGREFRLELALTHEQITRGLMYREHIPDDGGMLFVFPDIRMRGFWMKNCLVPIDVVFLDGHGFITAIHTMPPPDPGTPEDDLPSYSSLRPARFAIELAGGTAGRLGLQPGQKLDLPIDDLKRLVE